ncbi:tetratricopeptide repeat protein [Magnetococcales bacterium HHB-1]
MDYTPQDQNFINALLDKAATLFKQKNFKKAQQIYQNILNRFPYHLLALKNSATTYEHQQSWSQAIDILRRIHALIPEDQNIAYRLAFALKQDGQLKASLKLTEALLEKNENNFDLLLLRGLLFDLLDHFAKAEKDLRQVCEQRPDDPEIRNDLAITLRNAGRPKESIEVLEETLKRHPNSEKTRWNLSLTLLVLRDFKRGFDLYQSRRHFSETRARYHHKEITAPLWQLEDLTGKRLLVFTEQGFGDVIQFIRLLHFLDTEKTEVHVLIHLAPLAPFLRTLKRNVTWHENFLTIPPVDYHLPLFCLAHRFQLTWESIPQNTPYLYALSQRVDFWKQWLKPSDNRLRIGVVWGGEATYKEKSRRSLGLFWMRDLLCFPGVTIYGLQVDGHRDALEEEPLPESFIDLGPKIRDFADSAALLTLCDLVITPDTAMAHVAGALARPTITLMPEPPEWRWSMTSEETPWYPTMHLFRQSKAGDWEPVMRRVFNEVQILAQQRYPFPIKEAINPEIQAQINTHIHNANKKAGENQLKEAIKGYREALSLNPQSPEALFYLAITLGHTNASNEAIAYFETLLKIAPFFADGWFQYALFYQQKGHLNQAAVCYRSLLVLAPNHQDGLNNLGLLLMEQDRLLESERFLERSIDVNNNHAASWNNLGILRNHQERFDQARKAFKRAIALEPNTPTYRENLANTERNIQTSNEL